MIKVILACDDVGGIGLNNSMPWPHSSNDLARFKKLTIGSVVVMGRGTWESKGMPKPLPDRVNVVVSKSKLELPEGVLQLPNTNNLDIFANAWVIGGAGLVNSILDKVDTIHLSRMPGNYNCDTVIDLDYIKKNFRVLYTEEAEDHTYQVLARPTKIYAI